MLRSSNNNKVEPDFTTSPSSTSSPYSSFSSQPAPSVEPNIGVFLRFEVKTSLVQYQEFLKITAKYRHMMDAMSECTLAFAKACTDMSNCRGSEANGLGFKICGELYKTVGTNQKSLAESLLKDIEGPLSKNFDTHAAKVASTEKFNSENLKKIIDDIKGLEKKCAKTQNKKNKPEEYMKALNELTIKENELAVAKQSFFSAAVDEEKRNFNFILQKLSALVKMEANSASQVNSAFQEQVYPLLGLAFSPDGISPLPKELVEQYMGNVKASNISVVAATNDGISSGFGAKPGLMVVSQNVVERATANTAGSIKSGYTAATVNSTKENNGSIHSDNLLESAIPEEQFNNLTISSGNNNCGDLTEGDEEDYTVQPTAIVQSQPAQIVSEQPQPQANLVIQQSQPIQENNNHLSQLSQAQTQTQAAIVNQEQPVQSQVSESEDEDDDDDSSFYDEEETGGLKQVIALHNFTARDEREMSISKGQLIKVLRKENNWIYGKIGESVGWVPFNYTKPVEQ